MIRFILTLLLMLSAVFFIYTFILSDYETINKHQCEVITGNVTYSHYNFSTGEVVKVDSGIPIIRNKCTNESYLRGGN